MPALATFLDRFRPAPAPGRAGPVGVPSGTRLNSADELAPVFASLAAVEAECAAIRADAVRRAEEVGRAASEQVATMDLQAAAAAETARVTAAATARAAAEADRADELSEAHARATETYASGLARISTLVAAAVDRVRALGTEPR